VEEVTMAIIRLKNGKSAGIDGIQVELLKYGGEETTMKILQLCNRIWKTGEVPRDWRDGIQRKETSRIVTTARGITLLSVAGKIMTSILLNTGGRS